MKPFSDKDLYRFAKYVKINKITECWEWIGLTNGGKWDVDIFRYNGVKIAPRKFLYQIAFGSINKDQIISTCGNKNCINWDHASKVCDLFFPDQEVYKCRICGRIRPKLEFPIHDKKRNKRRKECQSCVAEYTQKNYYKHKEERIQYAIKRRENTKPTNDHLIYFITTLSSPAIKIGYTKGAIKCRMQDIQMLHYEDLICLGVIICESRLDESLLHRKFDHLHIRGEWHKASDELLRFIKDHAIPLEEYLSKYAP